MRERESWIALRILGGRVAARRKVASTSTRLGLVLCLRCLFLYKAESAEMDLDVRQ